MKFIHKSLLLTLLLIFGFTVAYFSSCKKIDLIRIAATSTEPVSNVASTSVKANGVVVDIGSKQTDYGFCWSEGTLPTINNNKKSAGIATNTGDYSLIISGLKQNTSYSVRSFIVDDSVVYYGEAETFMTSGDFNEQWLHYDDGANIDGIGYTSGGSFDVAIRFPKESLQDYTGGVISKIKFFPREGSPSEYYVTIWEGDDSPDLTLFEYVSNPNIGGWTEFSLPEEYPINTAKDLWIGYWVEDSPADTYPAGVDNGPAMTGYGDLISSDGGVSWSTLSTIDPPNLDYNWNLQAFVQNAKGETVLLTKDYHREQKPQKQRRDMHLIGQKIQSKNNSKN